jgi:hypothetical protein
MQGIHPKEYYFHRLKRDLIFVALSIILAILFIRSGAMSSILSTFSEFKILSSFVAGIFFTSIFTIAPASVALGEISHGLNPITLSLWGAFGALLGDLVIFFIIRDVFAEDLLGALKASKFKKVLSHFHFGFLRWAAPLLGALAIASPLPDEIGLTLMGAVHMKTRYLIPIAFAMNFVGVYSITLFASFFAL